MKILMWIPGLFWLFPCGGGDDSSFCVMAIHAFYSSAQIIAICTSLGLYFAG